MPCQQKTKPSTKDNDKQSNKSVCTYIVHEISKYRGLKEACLCIQK